MAVTKTVVLVPSQNGTYQIPGDLTADQVKSFYSTQIAGLDAMTSTSTTALNAGGDGETRTITFTPRTGNKG